MNNAVVMLDDMMIVLPDGVTATEAKQEVVQLLVSMGLAKKQEDQSAVSMLEEAAHCIGDRASERDTEAERSMAATIRAFNGMYGTELTEEQGWQFMVLLKMARAKGGDYRRDDYVDGAAYFALAGECRNDCT